MRIAVGGILHETSTFLPETTGAEDFARGFGLFRAAEICARFSGANMCIGGFVDAAAANGFEAVPLLWGFAYPSGLVRRADYDALLSELLDRLKAADAAGPLAGVLLDLHGAMVVEGLEDADGDVVAAVRAAIGRERPIVVTYDLHGNHTPQRMQAANASLGYDTYPHVDMAERGREAAALIARTVRGEIRPVTALAQIPLFWSAPRQVTAHPPMDEVLRQVHAARQRPGILAASVATGFPWADVPHLGASIFVVADGSEPLAASTARELADWIWTRRERWHEEPPSIREGLAAGEKLGRYPIVLADFNDNTGGGAPGDSTALLRTFVELDLQNALVLYLADPEAAAEAHARGTGANYRATLGGTSHPRQGAPLELEVEVVATSDGAFRYDGPMYSGLTGNLGPTAWLLHRGVSIVVVSKREQPLDPALPRSLGIDCSQMKYIGIKSAVHFRSGFEQLAGSIHVVDAPALHSHKFQTLTYRRRPPMYPLELT